MLDPFTHLRDVTQSDDLAVRPPQAISGNILVLSNTSNTQDTPVCYTCGTNGTAQTLGCDYPDASGNVTDPGSNVFASCGGTVMFLSLGRADSFTGQPSSLGYTCTIIPKLFFTILGGPMTS